MNLLYYIFHLIWRIIFYQKNIYKIEKSLFTYLSFRTIFISKRIKRMNDEVHTNDSHEVVLFFS